ncbi:Lipid A core O-antigen ligase [Paramagnetospirillum magnetotacticum MS-1]|uniref:Lipid A core O-antigen ligase n=1 Tax=Paramagnetospirillum magnetotacticum MS-1 TaxID=272627 RepID=A0A0C2U8I5_PARME|nr:O-antigen ligase family protein [Paramagnetospirillum magnetotacticum]KIL97812.1 Lipid A core O-antigen ligase [Paramagnetospirillum magnetotacticum MS-1]
MKSINASHALAFGAIFAPTVAIYAPLGMAPLFILVGVAVLVLEWRSKPWTAVWRPGLLILGCALIWMTIGLLWALDVLQALKTLTGLILLFSGGPLVVAAAGRLDDAGRKRVRIALVLGVLVGLGLAAAEVIKIGPGSFLHPQRSHLDQAFNGRISRGLTVSALLIGPALIAAWRLGRPRLTIAMALLAAFAIFGGHSLAAKLPILLAPLVIWGVIRNPGLCARLTMGGSIAVILAFPLLSMVPPPQETMDRLSLLPNSAHHRLTIWNFTATRILEHPLRGWGLDGSRNIPGAEENVLVMRRFNVPYGAGPDGVPLNEQLLPLHPHSGPGQIWLELGAVGVVMLCSLIIVLARRITTVRNPLDAAVTAQGIVVGIVVSSVSYGVWQSWWLCSVWLAAALAMAVAAGHSDIVEPDGNRQG